MTLAHPKPEKRIKAPKPLRRSAAPKRSKRPRKRRKSSVAALKRKLWALFAAYIKDRDGNVCFSCGKTGLEGQNWHAGHLISRRKATMLFSPAAVASQCAGCNCYLNGNIAEYAKRYIDRYGIDKFNALVMRSREHHEWKRHELEDLIVAIQKSGADYELLYAERYGT